MGTAVAFLASSLLVIVTPGPDLALITRLMLERRTPRPAAAAAAGMITAGAAQAALGAAGLAAFFGAHPDGFTAFRRIGAAVLLGWAFVALRSALHRPAGTPDAALAHGPATEPGLLRGGFIQGLLCTGSNPKVGVFLMAFLPQFVPPGVDPVAGVAFLAACYLTLGLLWLATWILLVGRLAPFLRSARAMRLVHGTTALVFGAFALRLVLV
ncbi:LysE family translocator [Actinomadura rubrisoli]|uniref:LysE family translocator n=1 Tax=Actinomadura rubrisoli TaxID=2530368 RepID=A0A4R5C6J1_9ACTN|nr:LysE family transporter [Actinomadura rubrisoli]TDD95308.1 LysE family translocator [Actinomadura rubrisoli]